MLTAPLWVSSGQDPAWREVTGQSSDGSKETSWKSSRMLHLYAWHFGRVMEV